MVVAAVCAVASLVQLQPARAQWNQWGGPNRDFMVSSGKLADEWPDDGPKRLWHRELGDGYATIVVDDGRLFTMYRDGEDEFTIALDAKTGKTLWEHKNPSPTKGLRLQFGVGPNSTPVVVEDRVYTIGTNMVLHCFDKTNGKILWKHDLVSEFGAKVSGRGYSASPIPYRDMLIVPVDRDRKDDEEDSDGADAAGGQSLIAFNQLSGSPKWKSQDYPISHSSPILINFEGEDQLVFLMQEEMIGVKPKSGELLWRHEFKPAGANLATPLWDGKDSLFCSSAYDSGSRLVRLSKTGDKTVASESWYTRKMRVHHGNAIRIGDYIYGSSGDSGPAFFMCIHAETGKVAWRERGFAKTTCVYADGKIILLDEDGQLALAKITPKGMTVLSKCTVAESYAWAAPTLVGTTLYVRDRKHIMALDLGKS